MMLEKKVFFFALWSGGFTLSTLLVVRPLKTTLFYVCIPLAPLDSFGPKFVDV